MKINMNLLPMKGHYFLFNAGTGPVVPFIPTLAKDLGFSSVVVGTLYTFLPIAGMVAKPTMGGLADRLHCQKAMFIGFIILCLCSFFVIPWIPALPTDSGAELHCDAESMVRVCSDNLRGNNCYLDRFRELGNSTVINCKMSCLANATFLHSICDSWHQPQLCPTPMSNLTHNTIHFDAQLYPHYIQTDNCMFIRLGRVGFDMVPGGRWVVPYCTDFQAAQCDMACNNAILQELTVNHKLDSSQILGLYQFWIFCACLIVGWVSMAVVVSVSDAICFEMLGEFPSKYGNQRLWGSIGWGIFSLLAGVIVDQFSKDQASKNYKPAFILMAVVLLLNVLVASKLKYKQVKTSTSILRDVGRLLSECRMVVFLLWCIAVGMCTAMMWNFLFWHLEELAKGDGGCGARNWIKTLEGTVMIVQCFGGELPFFFLSGWLLKKLSHVHSMSLVLLAFGARFLLYSALSDPWWVLPIEILNGPTFGMCYAAMTSYASIVAPPGTEATTQGLVGAVFEGLGISLGSFIGGVLFNSMSGSEVFRLFGIGAILCCLLHVIVQWILSRRTQVHTVHEKDFKPPRYASPNDAIHMLEDTLHEQNTH